MIMIQQQQICPLLFGRKFSDSDDEAVMKRASDTTSEILIQSGVIKETECVRKLIRRSVSPQLNSDDDKHSQSELLVSLSPTSIIARTTITKITPRFIKRSISIDVDDEYETTDRLKQRHKRYVDPEPMKDRDDDYRYTTDEDDGPLDLSLPSERRRHQNYSDTESDDSVCMGDDKAVGKAAYKKNLMKRYRKFVSVCNDYSSISEKSKINSNYILLIKKDYTKLILYIIKYQSLNNIVELNSFSEI